MPDDAAETTDQCKPLSRDESERFAEVGEWRTSSSAMERLTVGADELLRSAYKQYTNANAY